MGEEDGLVAWRWRSGDGEGEGEAEKDQGGPNSFAMTVLRHDLAVQPILVILGYFLGDFDFDFHFGRELHSFGDPAGSCLSSEGRRGAAVTAFRSIIDKN